MGLELQWKTGGCLGETKVGDEKRGSSDEVGWVWMIGKPLPWYVHGRSPGNVTDKGHRRYKKVGYRSIEPGNDGSPETSLW